MAEFTIKTKGNTLTADELTDAQEFIAEIAARDWDAALPRKTAKNKAGYNLQSVLDLTGSDEEEAPSDPTSKVDAPANAEGEE